MPDNNEIRDGLSNLTDQQTDSVIISNAQHKRTARLLTGLFSAAFLFATGIAVWFYNLEEKIEDDLAISKQIRAHVWFDPERDINNRLTQLDAKHPPMFEVWSGPKLLERWHWQSEDYPNSAQYKNWIIKCTANYTDGEYSGLTAQLMQGYPAQHPFPETEAKKNSIVFKADEQRGSFTFWTTDEYSLDHGIRYKINASGKWTISHWENGSRLDGKTDCTAAQIKESLKTNLIIQNHPEYIAHMANHFTFLKDVLASK